MKTLAVIPAKENSLGINKKNLIPFGADNLPLVQHTINAAAQSDVDEIVVVSDSKEILSRASDSGALAWAQPSWSTDKAVQVDTIVYMAVLETKTRPEIVICLQPTSPLRTTRHINGALKMFNEVNDKVHLFGARRYSVFSAYEVDGFVYQSSGIVANPMDHSPLIRVGRQEADDSGVLVENGAIYVVYTRELLKYRTFRVPPMVPYYMSEYDSIEVDEIRDLRLAESMSKFYEENDIS